MIQIADSRQPFAQQVAQFRRQRQWLIDLERLFDPSAPAEATAQRVAQRVDHYLTRLLAQQTSDTQAMDRQVAVHVDQTLREWWWGLFTCYDVEGLPRTNNELERFMRRIKSGQRQIVGRKNVHDFIIRYGHFAACVDYRETVDDLLARLRHVSQTDFLTERRALENSLLREQKRHRFRHHQADYLRELESRWSAALEQAAS